MARNNISWVIALAAAALGNGVQAAESVSGTGLVPMMNAEDRPTELPFTPKHVYAYASGEGAERRITLVLTDVEPPRAAWNEAVHRDSATAGWCAGGSGSYISFRIKAAGDPDGMDRCGKGGVRSSSGVNVLNGVKSIQAKLLVNDGKRLQGTIETGDGACGAPPKYCTQTGSFKFDTTLAIAPLIDRVWAQGKPNASELVEARKSLQAYWDAAGKAKSFADIFSHLSADRKSQGAAELKENPKSVERIFGRFFAPAHGGPLTIGEARLLGSDAMFATTNPATRGESKITQACRVLVRKEGDAWKVDQESCR